MVSRIPRLEAQHDVKLHAVSSMRASSREDEDADANAGHGDLPVADTDLVGRALAGERAARSAIYERYAVDIANVAVRLLRDRDDAADVTQDAFVTAFETLADLREPSRLRAWLRMIAVHHVQRRFRRRRLLRVLGIGPPAGSILLADLASRDASQEAITQLRRADAVLAKLPERPRIVWTLRYVEGATLPEIATACRVSLATVKRDLAMAQHRVRAALDAQEGP